MKKKMKGSKRGAIIGAITGAVAGGVASLTNVSFLETIGIACIIGVVVAVIIQLIWKK